MAKLSLARMPSSPSLQLTFAFLLLGSVFLSVPFLLPELNPNAAQSVAESAFRFQLEDPVNTGLFKSSSRVGQTTPSLAASYYGASALAAGGLDLLHKAELIAYAEAKLASTRNVQDIHYAVALYKAAGGDVSAQFAARNYDLLMSLLESNAGFRASDERSASVTATFHGLQALKALGKLDTFKQKQGDDFNALITFVANLRDGEGGFRDTADEERSVHATYHAVRTLAEFKSDLDATVRDEAFTYLTQFLAYCQVQDGGFVDTQVRDSDDFRYTQGSTVATAQGLYIMEVEKQFSKGVVLSSSRIIYQSAYTYLLANVKASGVSANAMAKYADAAATAAVLDLVSAHGVSVGKQPLIGNTVQGLGMILLVLGFYYFYHGQLPEAAPGNDIMSTLGNYVVALVIPYGLSLFLPQGAAFGVVFLACRAAYDLYNRSDENRLVVGLSYSTLHVVVMVTLFMMRPNLMMTRDGYLLLLIVDILTTVVLAFALPTMLDARLTVDQALDAGLLSWLTNCIMAIVLVSNRGELDQVVRMATVHETVGQVFVFIPLASLVALMGMSAIGAALAGLAESKQSIAAQRAMNARAD